MFEFENDFSRYGRATSMLIRAVLQMVVKKTTALLLEKVERFIFKYPKSPESQQQPYLKVKPQ